MIAAPCAHVTQPKQRAGGVPEVSAYCRFICQSPTGDGERAQREDTIAAVYLRKSTDQNVADDE